MDITAFRASLAADQPPAGLSAPLEALWFAGKGDWDKAHDITQPGGVALDWVHAYLHRVEGDLANAGYWYGRAGKPASEASLDDEWTALATTFLAEGAGA